MKERITAWDASEQAGRDQRARQWRTARRRIDSYLAGTRRALLAYWNGHRWRPGDPSDLLDVLHGFDRGRLIIVDGTIRPARVAISVAEATALEGRRNPVACGLFGRPA